MNDIKISKIVTIFIVIWMSREKKIIIFRNFLNNIEMRQKKKIRNLIDIEPILVKNIYLNIFKINKISEFYFITLFIKNAWNELHTKHWLISQPFRWKYSRNLYNFREKKTRLKQIFIAFLSCFAVERSDFRLRSCY